VTSSINKRSSFLNAWTSHDSVLRLDWWESSLAIKNRNRVLLSIHTNYMHNMYGRISVDSLANGESSFSPDITI
jgi:hypothetical protein